MDNKEKRVKYRLAAGGITKHYVFEQCLGPNREKGYAIFDEQGDVSFAQTFRSLHDQLIYGPLKNPPWLLTQFSEKANSSKSLSAIEIFNTVRSFVYDFVELPHDTLYDVLTLWIMSSYLPEKFESIPYIAFNGPRDSGKTRALEILWYLSYRGILSPSFSSASLFRLLDKNNLTLCLDEAEIYGNEQRTEILGIINAGYRKGQFIFRVNPDTRQVENFKCFGFKAFATINLLVSTIESRSIVVIMRRNVREVPVFVDKERANEIRFKLLQYRANVAHHREQLLMDGPTILSYLPLKNGRIVELFYPLIIVAPSEEIRQKVSVFAKEFHKIRLEEEKTSIEAELVEVLVDCIDFVKDGKLAIKAIIDKYNMDKTEKFHWNPKSVGRHLKKLGFAHTRISGGLQAVFYDLNLLSYLARRYTPEKMSLISQMSPFTLENFDHGKSDVSDKSDVSSGGYPSINDLTIVSQKLEAAMEKVCGICHRKTTTNWAAITNRSLAIDICEDCVRIYRKS